MSTLLIASILLLLLWPAYALLLRYSDRYALNRCLLLLVMVAVAILPFVSLDSPVPQITQSLQGTIEYVEQSTYQSLTVVPEEKAVYVSSNAAEPYGPVERAAAQVPTRSLVYAVGVGLMLFLLCGRMLLLLVLHLRSKVDDREGYRLLHKGASGGQAFTFGSNIYFSEDVPDDPDFEHILTHERVHARQLHTVDILLAEAFLCLFWFHPVAWWLRTQMRANLEYLVDKAVVNQGADRRSYQIALVRQSVAAQGLALALPFSEPSLKRRISRMTGLPEYRVVGMLAAVALTFWLGVAMLVVNGNATDFTKTIGISNEVSLAVPDLGELIAEHTQPNVSGIESFSLYLRRLPTPYEYTQIQQMLGALDHTELSIYEPCGAKEGSYGLQLSHWLNTEAQLPFYLMEDEILDNHYVFKLEPNGALNSVPKTPHVSAGYFTPKVLLTVIDENDSFTLNIHLPDYRDDLANEEIAVFINGERMPLKSKPAFMEKISGAYFDKVTKVRITDRAVPTWSQSYFANWGAVVAENGPPPVPANERMNCLLGMSDNQFGLVRTIRNVHTGSCRTWFERIELPKGREVLFYLNDDRSTAEEVLDRDSKYVDVQVGYNRYDPDGKIIVQVIDKQEWFVTRVE